MKPAVHWSAINEASCVAGMRLLFWVCRVCGRWPFRLILYPVLLWYIATQPVARRVSRDYLARVGSRAGVLAHFAAFAENILDKMLLWGGGFDKSTVTIHGAAPLRELIAARRGALLVCSHLGNLDLCRVMAHEVPGLTLTVLVHTRHAQAFNAMLAQIDPRSSLNLLQVTEITPATAMLLAERVARGEFVVIAGDRVPVTPGGRVTHADFLGQRAAFPVGPYILASVLECPLYMLFARRDDDTKARRFGLYFELLADAVKLPRKGREAMLETLAGSYAARLEYHCRRAPLEWFNFYDFWQTHASQ